MPYKSETAKNDGNERSFKAAEEKDPHHPAQGAGLLMSLSSDKAAKRGSLQDNTSSSSTMNPITPMDGFPAGAPVVAGVSAGGNHNHRLYHSPIKLNKESRAAEEATCCYSDHASTSSGDVRPLLSGDIHSHPSRNSWTPYHHQGMGGHSYFPPPFAPFPTEDLLDKRQVSDGNDNDLPLQAVSGGFGEKKKDNLEEDADEKEQPVISPASSSSTDKQDEEIDGEGADVAADSSPEERSEAHPHHPPQWPPQQQQQQHPAMYPPWQGQPGYPPAPPTHHPSYPPPQYGSNGYPLPPPWFGAAPYPPYSMHQHGETAIPGASAEPKDEVDWQQVSSASLNRCVPLKHPPPNRFWGYVCFSCCCLFVILWLIRFFLCLHVSSITTCSSLLPTATETLKPSTHYPTLVDSSIFLISSPRGAEAHPMLPTQTGKRAASCAERCAFVRSRDAANTMWKRRTLFHDKTRACAHR